MVDQIVAQLARLHRGRGGQHSLQIAMFEDQLRRGLWPHAGDARHIVDAIAHQCEHIAQPVWPDAELLDNMLGTEPPVIHRVVKVEARLDQLHQILVARHDCHRPPLRERGLGIARDNVVGFQPCFLDTGQAERAGRVADHRELGHQILRRGWALRLILVIQIVAE